MWQVFVLLGLMSLTHAQSLPPGLRLGVASASFQVEGAWNHSDKAESIWDRLTHTLPSTVAGGATGDVACDSHRLWKTDVALAADLGAHFYRFSVSWPRLLPNGHASTVSEAGAKYYNDLIDGLLASGVEPFITLYHWDLPQSLQDLGSWTNPLVVDWFADYSREVFRLYADRVKLWVTINEPMIMCDFVYTSGQMAPPIHDDLVSPHLCAKHVLMAHAKAYRIYDEEFKPKYGGMVSICNHAMWFEPDSDSAEDVEAAELAMQLSAGRYSEPIYGDGGWPASIVKLVGDNSARQGFPRSRLPPFTEEEIKLVKGTFDFYALNHYTSRTVRAGSGPEARASWGGWPLLPWSELNATLHTREHWTSGENSWLKVNPEGLRNLLVWLKDRYGPVPVMITENGYPTQGATLRDDARVDYYRRYLREIVRAVEEDGVNVTAYTAWTLLDNFEWIDGYDVKFGLYEVDFTDPDRKRTPRMSAYFYQSIIKHHSLDIPDDYYPFKDEL